MENDLILDLRLGDEFGAAKSEERDEEEMSAIRREPETQKHKRKEINDEERFLELSLHSAMNEPEFQHADISSSTTMKSIELESMNDHQANNSFEMEKEDSFARKKLRLSKDQAASLEESFKKHSTLNLKQKLVLAQKLNLKPRQVEVWFQNRRARTKLKKTEMDYEYLKRCCHMLTLENRWLQREVAELRKLRKNAATDPFYMHV